MRAFAQEDFGPIAAIARFASDMGRSASTFTNRPRRARRTVAELKAGTVGINSVALAASEAPFGGTKYSGTGREGGSEGSADDLDTRLAQGRPAPAFDREEPEMIHALEAIVAACKRAGIRSALHGGTADCVARDRPGAST